MLISCVVYKDGKRVADILPNQIHEYLSDPACFVWVALLDPDDADLEAMGRALSRLQVDNGVAVIHLGEINREDVIPQLAEFCLQIEGVDWSVVSGLVKDRVVISVRNVGYVKSAGEIMKRLYDDIGSAGGHRAMAKAVVPLDRFKQRFGEVSEKVIREAMLPMIVDRDQIELELH